MNTVAVKSLDARAIKWAVSLFGIAALTMLFPINSALQWAGLIGGAGFTLLLCGYFGWLLLARLQCSLLELCLVIAMLGNVEGLLLTTPGLMNFGSSIWVLVPLTVAWILAGAVKGAVQARILGEIDPLPRAALILANWFLLAAPALLLTGLLVHYGRQLNGMLISRNMAAWGPLLMAAGGVGCLVYIWLEFKVSRAAKMIQRLR